jgi:hypothetical protein
MSLFKKVRQGKAKNQHPGALLNGIEFSSGKSNVLQECFELMIAEKDLDISIRK